MINKEVILQEIELATDEIKKLLSCLEIEIVEFNRCASNRKTLPHLDLFVYSDEFYKNINKISALEALIEKYFDNKKEDKTL